MKKITLAVALLGSVYFSNAQVGIGTPTPHNSTLLDVKNTNGSKKGIKIASVPLVDTKTYTLNGTQNSESESILVFNTTSNPEVPNGVTPGFYYWKDAGTTNAHWEKILSQSDLDALINGMESDLNNIINLLETAYPSNNLIQGSQSGDQLGGGIVYVPGENGAAPTFEFVYYDSVSNEYTTKDITSEFIKFIKKNESQTLLVQSSDKKYQYYVSELYLFNATTGVAVATPTEAQIDGWNGVPPTGVYLIDVKNTFVKNFDTILQGTTTIVKQPGDTPETTVYYTVQEYIELLSQNNLADGVTKIVLDNNNQASFQMWNNTTNTWVPVENNSFQTIVKANETVTTFKRNLNGTLSELVAHPQPAPDAPLVETEAGSVVYEYNREDNKIQKIDLTADVLTILKQNEKVIDRVVEIANNGNVKETLNSVVTQGTANADRVNLRYNTNEIVSMHVYYNGGVTASVTDLVITRGESVDPDDLVGATLDFNIGTGIMYQVLNPTADTPISVVVEYVKN